jgi:hypothetical protein
VTVVSAPPGSGKTVLLRFSPKTFLEFTADEGAGAHCHVGAQRLALARIINWLDDTLGTPSPVTEARNR